MTLKQALNFVLSFSFEWLCLPEDGAWLQFGARGDDLNAADLYRWRRLQRSFAVACRVLHLTCLLNREWLSTIAHHFMLVSLGMMDTCATFLFYPFYQLVASI